MSIVIQVERNEEIVLTVFGNLLKLPKKQAAKNPLDLGQVKGNTYMVVQR